MENKKLKSNILLIDDDETIFSIIKNHLDDYNIVFSKDYNEALESLKEYNFDLFLVDFNLPFKNGLEIIKEFNDDKSPYSHIPSILVTSSSDESIIHKAFDAGAKDFISKPIGKYELSIRVKTVIENCLNLKKLHNQSQELKEYKKVLDESDIVSKADVKGSITYVNNRFCEVSGYDRDELIGKNHSIVRHPDTPKLFFKDLWDTLLNKKSFKGIIKNKKKNGDTYYVDATISPILDINGDIVEFLAIRHDVTSMMNPKRQLLDYIKNISNTTIILAQIANYEMIQEFYSEVIKSKFENTFKNHLYSCLPLHSTINNVYNLGNGLFGFVKNDEQDPKIINLFLEDILKKIRKNGIDFEGANYEIDVIFSFASKGEHLYEDALIGIYHGLETKESIIYANNFYEKKQKDAKQKLKTLTSIRNALKQQDRVISFYQPIVENSTQKIVKYESLIRMINQRNEVLTPYHFLDIAKKTGYYHQITHRVIENASNILDVSNISININLSLSDIINVQIRTELLDLVTKEKNRGRITFELLEDEHIKDFTIVKDFIGLVKILGDVKIAIDDFGSGYSNYERLLDFQPDFIKIDGSLIKNINEKYSRSIIKSIVLFAKENNIKTVAEFVADEVTYKCVKELGIDLSQGFYFGKPEPIVVFH